MSAADARENPSHGVDDEDDHDVSDIERQRVLPESVVELGHYERLVLEHHRHGRLRGHVKNDRQPRDDEDAEERPGHQPADQGDEDSGDRIADMCESVTNDLPEMVPKRFHENASSKNI